MDTHRAESNLSASGFHGVYLKDGKWVASVRISGRGIYVGAFPTIEEAIERRDVAQAHVDAGDMDIWWADMKKAALAERWPDREIHPSNSVGVYKNKFGNWYAELRVKRRVYRIGTYPTIAEAEAAHTLAMEHKKIGDFETWLAAAKLAARPAPKEKPEKRISASGIPGIFVDKNGKWTAQVSVPGGRVYAGAFATIEEAIERQAVARQHIEAGDFDAWWAEMKQKPILERQKRLEQAAAHRAERQKEKAQARERRIAEEAAALANKEPVHHFVPYQDLRGNVYNQLQVVEQVGEYIGSKTLWRCKCLACGGETTITQARLGIYDTCGCANAAALARGRATQRACLVDGTLITALLPTRKLNKNSSTGIRGVCRCGDGRYRATINLRRHQYDLGKFASLAEAALSRKQAEAALYNDFIERYNAGEFTPPKKATKIPPP